MRTHNSILAPFIAVLLCSCGPTERGQGAGNDTLSWKPVVRTEVRGTCRDTIRRSGCVSFSLQWPDITDSTPAARIIADSIRTVMFGGRPNATVYMDHVQEELDALVREFPTAPGWWFERTASIVTNVGGPFVSVTVGFNEFTGGAHPNGWVWAGTFDRRSGAMWTLDSVLAGAWRQRLDSLGEVAFRAAREIPDSLTLQEARFFDVGFSGNGRFVLAETWYPSTEGLEFYYNRYEVAAYVYGPTAITIPWSTVSDLLRPSFASWVSRYGKR